MPPSIVDKYEQILAADPRSRIFVELAKALAERGDHARAIEVCRQGLEHHPSSILGRVVWGRALLESGDAKGATDQFEVAIGLDPASPYAYNLVGETLLAKGLHREALPVLSRAAELQPADARVRGWLADARRRVNGAGGDAGDEADEKTEPSRPIRRGLTPTLSRAGTGARETGGATAAAERENGGATDAAATENGGARGEDGATGSAPTASATGTPSDDGVAAPPDELVTRAQNAAHAVVAPPPLPPPGSSNGASRSVLHMIPGEAARDVIGPARRTVVGAPRRAAQAARAVQAEADAAEAELIAARYAQELREKLLAEPAPPESRLRRHRRLVLPTALVLLAGAAAAVYLAVDARNQAAQAASASAKARIGVARDTRGALVEAARLLELARRRSSADPEIVSLSAQVAAVLAADFGDEKARALARDLSAPGATHDGAIAARYLLAETPAERREAEAAVLAARPSAAPLVQALAGRILAARGEVEASRGRLEIAARATPPLLRAMSDLGDAALAAGDPDRALALFASALAAQPTHPRAATGAAEARLLLGKDLDVARKSLAAVEADEGTPRPTDLALRYELVHARLLAATGDAAGAARRLSRAAETLGETASLASALAEIHLSARAWDRAEAAAARAVERAPKDVAARVLLARARIGRGRYAEALAATDGADGRAVRIQRAIAHFRLGQLAEARAELERTAKEGRMPAEAAVWYALTDVALGRAERAVPLLERLAAGRTPPPLAHVALGHAFQAAGRPDDAVAAYRAAVAREPSAPEGHLALGRALLARGKAPAGLESLERAVRLDPSDVEARRALGEARLASGQPSAARAELDAVLLAHPKDAPALRLVSAAWLAEGEPAEARRAADRAVAAAPRDPAVLLAGARAALATGDRGVAKVLAERALKAGAAGSDAVEARKLVGAAPHVAAKSRKKR